MNLSLKYVTHMPERIRENVFFFFFTKSLYTKYYNKKGTIYKLYKVNLPVRCHPLCMSLKVLLPAQLLYIVGIVQPIWDPTIFGAFLYSGVVLALYIDKINNHTATVAALGGCP